MPPKKTLGHDEERFRRYRALLAPGTPLRDGLDRIVHGRTGALVVLGSNAIVEQISTGGFTVNTEFTPTALRELAKMDGGIIVDAELETIIAAGVHFVPTAGVPTIETGTRHRTADRIAQQAHRPVVTVSASMSTIALFMEGLRYPIEPSAQIMTQADQALATLSRYRDRLFDDTRLLSALEIEETVTLRDLVRVAQRVEMVRRLAEELEGYVEALGMDGRLLQLQLFELTSGVDQLSTLLEQDYQPAGGRSFSLDNLRRLSTGELLDPHSVAALLGLEGGPELDRALHSRGLRQVSQVTQLSSTQAGALVEHFGSVQALFNASTQDLAVGGIGPARARAIHDGLQRLRERVFRGH